MSGLGRTPRMYDKTYFFKVLYFNLNGVGTFRRKQGKRTRLKIEKKSPILEANP
jgi:hypothetical protein